MSIYVDDLVPTGQNGKWRYNKSCHLFTDPGDLDGLYEFAKSIGLQPSCLHDAIMPHFDITEGKRKAAVSRGAVEVNRLRTVDVKRAWRAYRFAKEEGKL